MFTQDQIRTFLEQSLQRAEEAFALGNYPIGTVITDIEGNILTSEMNQCTSHGDLTAHAEIVALRKLGQKVNKYNPGEHIMFTSLEPCFGCSFFIARSNIQTIYSALKDPHKGGMSDLQKLEQFDSFFKNIELINDPFEDLEQRSRDLMRRYFLSTSNTEAATYYGHETES